MAISVLRCYARKSPFSLVLPLELEEIKLSTLPQSGGAVIGIAGFLLFTRKFDAEDGKGFLVGDGKGFLVVDSLGSEVLLFLSMLQVRFVPFIVRISTFRFAVCTNLKVLISSPQS
jgi:hypothetical protein